MQRDAPNSAAVAPAGGERPLSAALAEGLIVAAVVGWWAVARDLSEAVMPDPWTVAKTTAELFTEPDQLAHTLTSMVRVVASVILAVLLGTLLAFLPRRYPAFDVIVYGRIQPFLNAFPSVGWAIVASIWFGPSHETIVFVEVAILTPFCLVNVAQGLRELYAEAVEMARSFTRSRRKTFFLVTIPLLMPYIVAALRIAYGVGWKIALVAELFGTESGLGFLMLRAQTLSDAATVFAACFAVVILFIAGEKLVIDPLARKVRYH